MIQSERLRFVHPATGVVYVARLTPLELSGGGVSHRIGAIVFETAWGDWVGSAPLLRGVSLSNLGAEGLLELLEDVIGR